MLTVKSLQEEMGDEQLKGSHLVFYWLPLITIRESLCSFNLSGTFDKFDQ